MAIDTFFIQPYMKFMLIFRPAATLVLVGIGIYIMSSPYMELEYGYIGILALVGFAIYELSKFRKWYNFSVSVDDTQIVIGGDPIPWGHIESAKAKAAIQFSTFITIVSKDGKEYKIPGSIQESNFILTKIKKHFPDIKTEE